MQSLLVFLVNYYSCASSEKRQTLHEQSLGKGLKRKQPTLLYRYVMQSLLGYFRREGIMELEKMQKRTTKTIKWVESIRNEESRPLILGKKH